MRGVLPFSLWERTMARGGRRGGEEWAGEARASIKGKESLSAFTGMFAGSCFVRQHEDKAELVCRSPLKKCRKH